MKLLYLRKGIVSITYLRKGSAVKEIIIFYPIEAIVSLWKVLYMYLKKGSAVKEIYSIQLKLLYLRKGIAYRQPNKIFSYLTFHK